MNVEPLTQVWSLVMGGVRIYKVLVSEDFLDVLTDISVDAAREALENARDSTGHTSTHIGFAIGHLQVTRAALRRQLKLTDGQMCWNPHDFLDPMERYWAATYLLAMCHVAIGDKGIARKYIQETWDFETKLEARFRGAVDTGFGDLRAFFNPRFWQASYRKGHTVFVDDYTINRQDPAAALKALKLKRLLSASEVKAWLATLPGRALQLSLPWRRNRDEA
ncbi:hypothetical protein [Glycomyces paridis]|uniref:Uncharacterized protein n=1 Tax=Glycomyces paridis TaxID=2126555 RepID=A0A4V4HMC9_9ACTN|nr:hypothetical protein [Glycomyces paridis]THV21676.1 hypothetical protein E9998_24650 [Glycomyces paridis]